MDLNKATVVTEGRVWQKNLPELGDLELEVGPWENAAYQRKLQILLAALPREARRGGNVDPVTFKRLSGQAMVGTTLFGWRNLNLDGAVVPFDDANATKFLTEPKYALFYDGAVVAAKRTQDGITADQDALAGNSATSSLGGESGEAG